MSECLTRPIFSNVSGCLVENPTCRFAVHMGLVTIAAIPSKIVFLEAIRTD